ncbi:RNA methyltransferase [bacterium]|jgi:TrmH family RNA methyltransferase|nr:RNA methyltransferase [bacterium]
MDTSNLSIIVVRPKYPENIGSIARACMNFGIKSIILINPCDYLVDEAFMLAKHAKPLLYKAEVRENLSDCCKDHHVLIGTTQRRRDKQVPFYYPKEIFEKTSKMAMSSKIGIVFGREDSGLTNEDLSFCNFQSSIPASQENSVFNLSQAVLIYLYEWFNFDHHKGGTESYRWTPAEKHEESILYSKLETVISDLPIDTRKGVENFTGLFKRVFSRAVLEKRDIRLFHKLFDLVSKINPKKTLPNPDTID